jgi:phospholipid transport system transporter-binding protein
MSECSIRTGNNGTVYLDGEINFESTPDLYRKLESRFAGNEPVRIIDLGGVGHADSSGLALLLELQAIARRRDHRLHIINTPDNLLRLAKLCEADKLLEITGRDHKDDESV